MAGEYNRQGTHAGVLEGGWYEDRSM